MLEKLRSTPEAIWTIFIVALAHSLDDHGTYRRTCGDWNDEKRLRPAKNGYGVPPMKTTCGNLSCFQFLVKAKTEYLPSVDLRARRTTENFDQRAL